MKTQILVQQVISAVRVAKAPLCLLIGFSSVFGYCFAAHSPSLAGLLVFIGTFFLSCGGASFNSYQEKGVDAAMMRTAERPLVLGQYSDGNTVIQGIVLVAAGLFVLYRIEEASFYAGIAGLVLYNGVYTPLKSKTVFALIPGALCGAIPAYIGWLAGDGVYVSYKAALVVSFLILWQIPHFLLVLLNHKTDYEKNILPNLLRGLSEQGVKRVFLCWVTALVCILFLFSVIPDELNRMAKIGVVVNGLLLLGISFFQVQKKNVNRYTFLFRYLNFSIFIQMLIVCLNGVIS